MSKRVRRGYEPNDEKEFNDKSNQILFQGGKDLYYLLNQGYAIKGACEFVGNHYQLSKRQRMALMRGISSNQSVEIRKNKLIKSDFEGTCVNIDGFNTIITLEVALSQSLLFKCMDSTIRDLAGLRGNYRLIEQTETAIRLIGKILEANKVTQAVFYLDAPVSNSGRLKERLFEILSEFSFEVVVEVIHNVDQVLECSDYVITSDAIILDKCRSWINLNERIIQQYLPDTQYVDFIGLNC